ncbi:MAG: flavin reductase family protein [Elusimicrobia bacterium]|nr:flavin reductase family protein [Elusimicrobiota bacterium]
MREVSSAEAWKRKYPEQVVLVVSWDEKNNRANIITLGWSMTTSFGPPMVAISVGHTRYSHQLISSTKEFVLAFPTLKMEKDVLFCGTNSGRDVDKFISTGLTPMTAKKVKPPLIKECLVNMECKVTGQLVTGDHTIFAGEIVAAYVSDETATVTPAAGTGDGRTTGTIRPVSAPSAVGSPRLYNFGNGKFGGVIEG